MSSAALRSARPDAASGGSRFRDHVNHPDYEVLAYIDGDFQPDSADWIPVLDKAAGGAFTRRQRIGVQTTDVPYPAWAESQSPDQ